MTVLFDGELDVLESYFSIEAAQARFGDLADAFAGQENGLCGAALSGRLAFITGLPIGRVPLQVEALSGPSDLDPEWEDVVEASFQSAGEVRLRDWSGQQSWRLALSEGPLRVRYCLRGMDLVRDRRARRGGRPTVTPQLIQFWPAPLTRDAVLKQGSMAAASWHQAWAPGKKWRDVRRQGLGAATA
ncbi:hypothetical protein [Amycolatopsis thermoflava]|uniref:hypothetical protein n=1 Tax=Amycolatopsis thermoflava TaxID=84480 RepID=UPI0006867C48|nr:hypothetical protein [Amycolatopsis thermoflava]